MDSNLEIIASVGTQELELDISNSISIEGEILELFPCKVCGKCFDKKSKLYNHNKIHSNKKYTCNICFRIFTVKSYLDIHRQTHSPNKKNFKCHICLKGFAFKKYLTTHLKIHRSDKPYECKLCLKTFATSSYLSHHRRIHFNEKSFVCSVCSKTFLLKEYLIRHSKTHDSAKTGIFDSYEKEEKIETNIEQTELNQSKFGCVYCSKSFSAKRFLTRHVKIHNTMENLPSESTANKSDLSILSNILQSDKKSCPLCFKTFLLKGNLKRHIVNIHSFHKANGNNQAFINNDMEENQTICINSTTSSSEIMFQCPLCSKFLSNKYNLKSHLQTIHLVNENKTDTSDNLTNEIILNTFETKKVKKKHECKKCLKLFSSTTKLSYHQKLQRCPRGFQCPICEQCFKRDYSLKFHLREHDVQKINSNVHWNTDTEDIFSSLTENSEDSKNETFECQVCFETFISKRSLTSHAIYHTSEKIYKCSLCSKGFLTPRALYAHKRIHLSNCNFECHICHENFTGKTVLTNHMRVHIYEKTYSCEICELVFCTENALKNHLIHHDELRTKQPQRYICEACGVNFTDPSQLAKHLENNEHIGICCSVCERYLSSEQSLIRHMRVHEDNKPISSRSGRFKSSFRINNKLKRIDKSNYYKQRDLSSNDPSSFNHQEDAFFYCKICSKFFSRRESLKRHLNTHLGVKPYECDICGKFFSQKGNLLTHKSMHNDERPFVCSVCSGTFKTKAYLVAHAKQHSATFLIKCDSCPKVYSDHSGLRKHRKNTGCGKQKTVAN